MKIKKFFVLKRIWKKINKVIFKIILLTWLFSVIGVL